MTFVALDPGQDEPILGPTRCDKVELPFSLIWSIVVMIVLRSTAFSQREPRRISRLPPLRDLEPVVALTKFAAGNGTD